MSHAAALLLAFAAVCACGPVAPAPTLDPNADVILRYSVAGGGEIVFTVRPGYPRGQPVELTVALRAGAEAIRGPLTGRVLFSGIEGEQIVRDLGPSLRPVDVPAGTTSRVTVSWDARDARGELVPAESYSVTLDFLVGPETTRVGTVLRIVG